MLPSPRPEETWRQGPEAGPDQVIVVYGPPDTGGELDPSEFHGRIAAVTLLGPRA
jgi:hypothetical protein